MKFQQIFFTSSVYTYVLKFLIINNVFFLTFLRFQSLEWNQERMKSRKGMKPFYIIQ